MPRKTRATNAMEHPVKMAFTVPEEDVVVLDWIRAQNNLSTSLRLLIKAAVPKTGYVDYLTSLPLASADSEEDGIPMRRQVSPALWTRTVYEPETKPAPSSSKVDEAQEARYRDLKSMMDA